MKGPCQPWAELASELRARVPQLEWAPWPAHMGRRHETLRKAGLDIPNLVVNGWVSGRRWTVFYLELRGLTRSSWFLRWWSMFRGGQVREERARALPALVMGPTSGPAPLTSDPQARHALQMVSRDRRRAGLSRPYLTTG